MIKDEDLKSRIDYSEGQKKAAHRVLVELVNIFREYDVSNLMSLEIITALYVIVYGFWVWRKGSYN